MKKKTLNKVWIYLLLIAGAVFFIIPFFWMFSTSLKSYDDVFAFPPVWWPSEVLWSNYAELLTELPFLRYTLNTVFVTGMTCLLHAFVLDCGLWLLILQDTRNKILFRILLVTLMIPPQVTMIPQFVLFNRLAGSAPSCH
jgi:multiple sugar transport system permease protein